MSQSYETNLITFDKTHISTGIGVLLDVAGWRPSSVTTISFNILIMFHNKIESFKTLIKNVVYNGLFKTRIPCVFVRYSMCIRPVFHPYSSRRPRVVQVLTTRNKREKESLGVLNPLFLSLKFFKNFLGCS
jgi:hypothetical protein